MKKAAAWFPSLVWMGLIFMMSAMPGDVSGAQSGALLELLLSVFARVFPFLAAVSPDMLHLLLRKGAHMAAYAVLALLNARALFLNGSGRPYLFSWILAAAYAASDEFHQGFVAGRGPSVLDVMIDLAGAAAALIVLRVFIRYRKAGKTPPKRLQNAPETYKQQKTPR